MAEITTSSRSISDIKQKKAPANKHADALRKDKREILFEHHHLSSSLKIAGFESVEINSAGDLISGLGSAIP